LEKNFGKLYAAKRKSRPEAGQSHKVKDCVGTPNGSYGKPSVLRYS